MARMGAPSSEIRAQLIDAASRLIQEEGCNAVTARRLSEEVGLKRQIVHYYFGTIDDLFIAVLHRDGEKARERFAQALESGDPLRVSWELANDASAKVLEFLAISIHRESIQAEVRRFADEFRKMQTEALERHLALRGIKPHIPPVVATLVIASISQALALEKALGISQGHAETIAFIESWLQTFNEDGDAPTKSPR